MKQLFTTSFFLLILVFTFSYANTDVSGEWKVTIQTEETELTQNMKIEQDGESLQVIMEEGVPGAEMKGEGTIKDNEIEWTVSRSIPQGKLSMTYTGKVEGDSMSGTVIIANQSVEWTAVRKES